MAIAFGAAVNATVNSGSTTVSQTGPTVSGSNTIGVAVLSWQSNESLSSSSVTWGGVNMTLVNQYSQEGGNRRGGLWYILNPGSGSTVQATRSSGINGFAIATIYYTGAKQSGQPDSSATPSSGASTAFSPATTVVASGCWLVSTVRNPSGGIAASTGSTARCNFIATSGPGFGDSNGTVGTGSQSMTWTGTSDVWNGVIFSIAPAADATNSGFFGLM